MGLFFKSALAIESLCFSPPDNLIPFSPMSVSYLFGNFSINSFAKDKFAASLISFSEATSSLDAETEDKIQKAVNILTQGRTTIVIAHRLSTILNSNKIYVIDSGLISGEGTHEELLKNSNVYKNFYQKQIKKS